VVFVKYYYNMQVMLLPISMMVIAPLHLLGLSTIQPTNQEPLPNFNCDGFSDRNTCAKAWKLSAGQQFFFIYTCHNNWQEA